MAKGGRLAEEALQICTPLIEALGVELIDADFIKEGKHQILRLYIDKRGGVGLDDCSAASHAVSDALDEQFSWKGPYLLEVSSPGLDRPLKTAADFARHQGEELELRFYKSIDGKKELRGLLKSADSEFVILDLTDSKGEATGEEAHVALADCAKISRVIRF